MSGENLSVPSQDLVLGAPSQALAPGASSQVFGNTNVTKLNGKNFRTWKEMVMIILQLRGLSNAVKGDIVDENTNLQAKLILLEAMDESHRAQVMGCIKAKEVMQRLELIYADNSAANIYRLMHRYYRYKKSVNDSMSIHRIGIRKNGRNENGTGRSE